jgi:hypothetical protein
LILAPFGRERHAAEVHAAAREAGQERSEGRRFMMHSGLRFMLMLFALVGFGGAGAAMAVARQRLAADGERDLGMLGVAGMLVAFATLCASVASGMAGVLAFGGTVLWVSYVGTAQRIGLFTIETGRLEAAPTGEPRQTY